MSDLQARLQVALGGAYRVERELGGGGMSRVFVAEETELGRRVVIKVLPPELAAGVNRERFLREIHLAATLQHPHVVPLLTAGHTAGLVYYTMPLIEGESLRAKLAREGALPVNETVRILRDVVDALTYAHRHGVMHRDIKPDNVLVADHHAVVTDFGVARALSESTGQSSLTSVGVALGTPAYMAPEQAAADPHADHRCDIYAVGALGYEMLTGRPPFTGSSPQQVLAAQVSEPPVPVTKHRAAVPPPLAEAVMRCLEKNPADRWQTADDLLHLLEAMATPSGGTMPIAAVRKVAAARFGRVAVGVAILIVLGVAALMWRSRARSGAVVKIDPNVVVVLPFRVTGADPSLAYLRQGMIDLLATELTGEGGPRAADPRTVLAGWRRVAPSPEADLPEDAATGLAARLGAGLLLVGGVVGTPSRVVLTASLLAVPGGGPRAQARVEGRSDSLAVLVDGLVAQLLVRQAGEVERTTSLGRIPLPALRAYLDGAAAYRRGLYEDALRAFGRALALDSEFALAGLGAEMAAVWTSNASRGDSGLARAWASRNQLSPRDEALLVAYAGPHYPAPSSGAEMLAATQRALDGSPDRPEMWYEVGDQLFHLANALGQPNGPQGAAAYFRRAIELDSAFAGPLTHLAELSLAAGDTAEVSRLTALYLARDSIGETADFVRWLGALASGLPGAARQRPFARMPDIDLMRISGVTLLNGRWLEDGDSAIRVLRNRAEPQAARITASLSVLHHLLNRGRAAEQARATADLRMLAPQSRLPFRFDVLDALYSDGDSLAAAAGFRVSSARADLSLSPTPVERAEQYADICTVEQWRLAHGDGHHAARAIAELRRSAELRDRPAVVAEAAACATLLEALVAAHAPRADASAALNRLDSLMRTWPLNLEEGIIEYGNLVVARLQERQGDRRSALAAARRWYSRLGRGGMPLYFSTNLREEGRLAALTGDRAGAMRAYQHYLALRAHADPVLQHDVERVRAELARLVAEQKP